MSGDLYDDTGDWWRWSKPSAVGLTEPSPPPAPPATGLTYEVPPVENFLRNMATGAAGLAHGTGVLATGLLARGAGMLGYEDTFDPAFRYLDQFKDSVDRRYGPRANEHVSGWSRVAGLAGQAAPMIVGTALTGGAGGVAEGASLGMNALRMAAAAAPWSGASALSQTAGAVRSRGLSTEQAERMLAGKYGEQELLAAVPFSAGGRFAEAAGLTGLKALPVKAAAGTATQVGAGPVARAVGNLGLDETTREYAEPVAPGWEDLISGAAFGALHGSRGLRIPLRGRADQQRQPPPAPPPQPPTDHSVPPIAPPPAGRVVSGGYQGDSTADTIPAGRRMMVAPRPPLPPVHIEFPALKLGKEKQSLFVDYLSGQQATLNDLSLTDPASLDLNRLNYPHIQRQIKRGRRLARGYMDKPKDQSIDELDMAHALDPIAGGFAHHFVGFQDPVQEYIGSLWRTRAEQIVPGRMHQLVPVFKEEDGK